MPTYQYACTQCEAQMEVVQSFSDDALTICPECQGKLRKVYSAVGIVFKGSGFYRTDSGSSSNSSSITGSSGNGSSSANGAAKSESTSDSASSGTSGSASGGSSGSSAATKVA
ncbi:FmdB family zinc ribbon protein [Marinitenerispora sediminis]|uniref:FmdB family transcriptional regulator n=1 Tax=Marinitenerispora sediminis TaxID=1931232 RepID=A0A368TAX3_9ACTN|nr:FmdB family zinc ribbon protein [Marinitenerispora sediminis]RCV57099.1 FmdB family transcriptional regulator [Marinitenerispora sediminis]RCV58906.1 FmdB family transcriptional regulator [Marinitenerispora sediminis]RCV62172.1 FmdB family transcriptional regulator [Marinitenerispora sediminis]